MYIEMAKPMDKIVSSYVTDPNPEESIFLGDEIHVGSLRPDGLG